MSMSSAFPLEIYEHILELFMQNVIHADINVRYIFCYVCTAWRWKCRALAFRYLLLTDHSVLMMQLMRRKLIANPHLLVLVEHVELRILLSGSPYQAIVEGFPSMLGRFLPRLRRVTIISSTRPVHIHRYFSIRRVMLHTVTVLEVSNFLFGKTITFEWFIAPFPSLRVLDLWSVAWQVPPNLPKMPPISELELGLRGNDWDAAWQKDNREAYEKLLNATRGTLCTLSINLFSLYILTSLHDYKSDDISLPTLEELTFELNARRPLLLRGKDGKALLYRECVPNIASFLARIDAKKIRVLNFSFDMTFRTHIVSEDDFLDSLRDLRKGLEDLVHGKHLPSLQTINIVIVGSSEDSIPMWQDRFNSTFPLLATRGLLRVQKYIRRV